MVACRYQPEDQVPEYSMLVLMMGVGIRWENAGTLSVGVRYQAASDWH